MRVLILTVTVGQGHNATANAIDVALTKRGICTKTIDAYKYVNKALSDALDKGTAIYTKFTPDIYRVVYEMLDKGVSDERLNMLAVINSICMHKFSKLLDEYNPDVVVCTHVFAAQLMDEIKRRGKTAAKIVGIITDYTIHPYWESIPTLDACIIASEKLEYRAVKKGIPKDKIFPLGIPIHPKFYEHIDKSRARSLLNISQTAKVILIMGGGLGYGISAEDTIKMLGCHKECEIIVVCGKSKRLYGKFQEYVEEKGEKRLHVFGYVDNIHVIMSACDAMVSKPGGLSVTEAFAKRLPIVIINPLAGQEERNAEFLLNCGLAMFANKTFSLDEAMHVLLNDEYMRERIIKNIDNMIIAHSGEKICDLIEKLG